MQWSDVTEVVVGEGEGGDGAARRWSGKLERPTTGPGGPASGSLLTV